MPLKGRKQVDVGKTSLQQFCARWADGCGSGLCEKARKIVLGRGTVPCDVLLIGEAPGASEDVIGLPFVGPAGKLLDHIVERSVGEFNQHAAANGRPLLSCAFTNLVCCIPLDDEGDKLRQPGDKDVRQCSDRLREFVRLCDEIPRAPDHLQVRKVPGLAVYGRLKLIVCVGAVSRDWLDEKRHSHVKLHRVIPRVTITHPAAALRANTVQRDHMVRQAVVVLTDALEEYVK